MTGCRRLSAALIALLAATPAAHAMGIAVVGDQVILSGPVVAGDYEKLVGTLAAYPEIHTAVLRYSPGGDSSTGYRIGDLFRARGFTTGVSGFCYSSCSRMFLGGTVRAFTDDFPANTTEIGLHGHYDRASRLDAALVKRLGLKDWIIAHSDGKADPALVERWINIPVAPGMIHFYNPRFINVAGSATFFCAGPGGIFDCERIGKTALDLGIVTTLDEFRSNDRK